jgi:UDPglucose 6-dehydrogenase
MMVVAVIGAGYVGLVQAAGLAHLGHQVRLGESDPSRVERLASGSVPIFEPGLEELFDRGVDQGLITIHSDNLDAVDGAEVVFLTLPTPPGDGGRADLGILEAVVDQLAPALGEDTVLVTKSTVPIGTAEGIRKRLRDAGSAAGVAANPEFLSEGNAVEDFLRAERIVVGAFDEEDGRRVADLYRGLPSRILTTDPVSAELLKYAANAYLATRLTFANSIANLAEEMGADALEVIEGVGLDRRIGRHFMRPGPGYGGSCFPKDTAALLAMANDLGYDFSLLRAVIETNERQRVRIADRARALLGGLGGRRIAVWGVAFKAGTDDIRESPALELARLLSADGADVVMFDPEARTDEFPVAEDELSAVDGADLLLVATEWPQFRQVEMDAVARRMSGEVVYDTRNVLAPDEVRSAGLRYVGLGRRV